MKKRALMAFPKLTATEEMKQIAASDMPRKEKTKYGYVTEVCDYYVYLRCVVQAGILKAALFFPDYLRLDGNNPVYEVYLDKENRQFTTYDCLNQKWSEAKLDRLDWKHWYAKSSWVSEEEAAVIQTYLDNDKRGASAILQFQRAVRDEQLVQRHRLETTSTTITKKAVQKQGTVPIVKRKCRLKGILTTIRKVTAVAAAIRWYSKHMAGRGTCRQKNILLT